MAWDAILKNPNYAETQMLRDLFPNEAEILEEYQFPKLHRAVLGFLEIEANLSSGQADVNATDSQGRTALGWAALRNDERAVRLLLEANADPNICDHSGRTTLTNALRRNNVSCIEGLLALKSTPAWNVMGGETAIHSAAGSPGVTTLNLKRMVAAGGDPNVQNRRGTTPLAFTTVHDNHVAAACLLDLGADVNSRDHHGYSALGVALRFRSSNTLQLLLYRGADYQGCDSLGNSALHAAAAFGDVRILGVLRRARLRGIDPDARDRQGKTASQLAQARTDQSAAFVEKLEELLADIRARNAACEQDGEQVQNVFDTSKVGFKETFYQALMLAVATFSGTVWMEPLLWPRLGHVFYTLHQRVRSSHFYHIFESQGTMLQQSRWIHISLGWTIGILCGLVLGLKLPAMIVQ